jgi:hypothetical protein
MHMPFATTLSIPRQRRASHASPTRKLILAGLAYAAVVVLIGAAQIALDVAAGVPVDATSSAASQAFVLSAQL